jgi:hypothetical protein
MKNRFADLTIPRLGKVGALHSPTQRKVLTFLKMKPEVSEPKK